MNIKTQFKKGTSGNPKGRQKKAKPVKVKLERLLENTFPVIEAELNSGSPEIKRVFRDLTKVVLTVNT
jgi:hypothetical protein